MPERISGEPDQFEQILKDYCEERFGEARPVETVWSKLALELNAISDEKDGEDELAFQPAANRSSLPAGTGNTPVLLPVWRRQGKFALVAGLALAAITGLVVIALVLATTGNQSKQQTGVAASTPGTSPKTVPTLTPQPSGALNLIYPGSRQLTLDPNEPWPFEEPGLPYGVTISEKKSALATSTDYNQVVEYYRQTLTKAGYTISDSQTGAGLCEKPPCQPISSFTANNGSQQIGIMVLSPQSWLPLSASIYMYIGEQAKATETVVLLNVIGPVVTVAPPPATVKGEPNPTVTATPDAPTTPKTTVKAVASEPTANIPTTATPPATSDYPDLTYPGSKRLTLKAGGPWITGQLDLTGKTVTGRIALAASGGYSKIVVYYMQLLSHAGFSVQMPSDAQANCSEMVCYGSMAGLNHFIADKGKLHIEVRAYEAQDWNSAPLKLAAQLNLEGQILAPDTLVLFTLATDN